MDANTKWIWKQGLNGENTWMDLVKKFTLDTVPEKAMAKIAVDSKYWLYINGEKAVFEGGCGCVCRIMRRSRHISDIVHYVMVMNCFMK